MVAYGSISSHGIIWTPRWGIIQSTGLNKSKFAILGLGLTRWFIFTTLLPGTRGSTLVSLLHFFTLDVVYLLLYSEAYTNDTNIPNFAADLKKISTTTGLAAASVAWYAAWTHLQDSRLVLFYSILSGLLTKLQRFLFQGSCFPLCLVRRSS